MCSYSILILKILIYINFYISMNFFSSILSRPHLSLNLILHILTLLIYLTYSYPYPASLTHLAYLSINFYLIFLTTS